MSTPNGMGWGGWERPAKIPRMKTKSTKSPAPQKRAKAVVRLGHYTARGELLETYTLLQSSYAWRADDTGESVAVLPLPPKQAQALVLFCNLSEENMVEFLAEIIYSAKGLSVWPTRGYVAGCTAFAAQFHERTRDEFRWKARAVLTHIGLLAAQTKTGRGK